MPNPSLKSLVEPEYAWTNFFLFACEYIYRLFNLKCLYSEPLIVLMTNVKSTST